MGQQPVHGRPRGVPALSAGRRVRAPAVGPPGVLQGAGGRAGGARRSAGRSSPVACSGLRPWSRSSSSCRSRSPWSRSRSSWPSDPRSDAGGRSGSWSLTGSLAVVLFAPWFLGQLEAIRRNGGVALESADTLVAARFGPWSYPREFGLLLPLGIVGSGVALLFLRRADGPRPGGRMPGPWRPSLVRGRARARRLVRPRLRPRRPLPARLAARGRAPAAAAVAAGRPADDDARGDRAGGRRRGPGRAAPARRGRARAPRSSGWWRSPRCWPASRRPSRRRASWPTPGPTRPTPISTCGRTACRTSAACCRPAARGRRS